MTTTSSRDTLRTSGAGLMAIGLGAAAITFLIGRLVGVSLA